MPDDDQPITRADLNHAADTIANATAAAIAAAIAAAQAETATAIAAAQAETAAALVAAEQRDAERSRDMQTEILRGIEGFARGNFARMNRLETSDADTNARITALEERVLYLETRRPPQ